MPFTKLLILKAFVGIKTSSLVPPPEKLYLVSQKSKRSDWKDHSVQVPSVTEREFRMFDDF